MPIEKFGRYTAEVEETIENRERLALRNKVKSVTHSRDIRGIKRRDRNENVFARPIGRRENAETAISCRRSGPARNKNEVYLKPGGGGSRCTDVPVCRSNRG